MATYKVIQDIEAEDKLLGPLTLRQFIYAAIVLVLGFIAFRFATVKWFLAIPFLPPIGFFALLAAPFGHDQPNEVWLLAKIRFALKPRRRIWDQSGVKELVSITVPKRIEKQLLKNLTQGEVRSRLQALANTIDSRGWAIKNVSVNMYAQPSYVSEVASDRLLEPTDMPQEVPALDLTGLQDVLDEDNNPTAQHLEAMIRSSSVARREQLMANMQSPATTSPGPHAQQDWFMQPPGKAAPAVDETVALKQLHEHQRRNQLATSHLHGIPASTTHNRHHHSAEGEKQSDVTHNKTSATTVDPAILELANRNDLTVATVARQANQRLQPHTPPDEVVVSLR